MIIELIKQLIIIKNSNNKLYNEFDNYNYNYNDNDSNNDNNNENGNGNNKGNNKVHMIMRNILIMTMILIRSPPFLCDKDDVIIMIMIMICTRKRCNLNIPL